MNTMQRLSLLWRRFTPLEEQLLAAVREVLPRKAQAVFDAQVDGITLVQRLPGWSEIDFYRQRRGKVDWSDVPSFSDRGEFSLAEVRFAVDRTQYRATLQCISGHIFDFSITPRPKAIAFATWDTAPATRLLNDPTTVQSGRAPEQVPAAWEQFMAARPESDADGWSFYDTHSARRTVVDDSEFLILAERDGDEFVMHRIEPPDSRLFYLASHDGTPEPIRGAVGDLFLRQKPMGH